MVVEHGGLETARYLLHAETVSEGYTALWERKRLDLTVEAMILRPEWREVLTPTESGRWTLDVGDVVRLAEVGVGDG